MNIPFTYEEGSLLIRLLMAHCVSDFFLQSAKAVLDKQKKILRSPSLYGHILITAVTAWVFIADLRQWPAVLIIAVTHLFIDAGKLFLNKKVSETAYPHKEFWLFVADQFLHVAVIAAVWLNMTDGARRMTDMLGTVSTHLPVLLRLFGYMILVGPVPYIIRFLTRRWSGYLDTREGLQDAGKWIGVLERILILTLVYIDQYTAIGFLVAAKSILRLIDKPETVTLPFEGGQKSVFNARKHTEYVLIGTFMSFGSAIITGLIINALLGK